MYGVLFGAKLTPTTKDSNDEELNAKSKEEKVVKEDQSIADVDTSANADKEIADKEIADKEIADKEIAGKEIPDKEEIADEEIADKEIADKEIADKEIADKEIADKEIADKEIADKENGEDKDGDDDNKEDSNEVSGTLEKDENQNPAEEEDYNIVENGDVEVDGFFIKEWCVYGDKDLNIPDKVYPKGLYNVPLFIFINFLTWLVFLRNVE